MSARPSLREADSLQSHIEDELDADIEDELTENLPAGFRVFRRTPPSLSRALHQTGQLRCRARGPPAPLLSPSPRPASSSSRGRDLGGDARAFPSGP